ncbi:outer membrane beta-barrel protein [Vibrio coralliilyticus]|uniref:outer membrane beta-barrel protein n=1 Tax=Vibrio coralliilyticus TaxID=190893 RepID=UPI0015614A75|nr:outer membrane beta-barrel protein [Vibrio coralliilyticus]NRF12908.1 porin family protein [Vibrio coralliilyticus]
MKKILLLAALLPAVASAQTFERFYVGAGLGSTDFDERKIFEGENAISAPYSTDPGNTVKFIAGYQINRIVSVEAQYTNYGDVKFTFPEGNSQFKFEHTSVTVAANLGYTFDNGVRPFTTIGLGSMSIDTPGLSDSGSTYRLGLGLDYTPVQLGGVSFRAAYEVDYYEVEVTTSNGFFSTTKTYDPSIGAFYLAATYRF